MTLRAVRRTTHLRAAAVAAARAVALLYSRRAHPRYDGTIRASDPHALHADVRIVRDRAGVPHIYASTDVDAMYGQGFVHAQDRLFQADSMRMAAAGRVAEWAGRRGLNADRFMRRVGLAQRAAADFAACGAEERALLEAYAAGFNDAVRAFRTLPPEYALLRREPEPWRPDHSLLVGRMLLFAFASNWDTELLRERLLQAAGPEGAAALDATYASHAHTVTGQPYIAAADRLLSAYREAVHHGLPAGGASNAWAVAGTHTASGNPLLANDPHLPARLPGLLHVAHVSGGTLDVIGAGVPGLPGVISGHNRALAWGVTAGMADVADCYIETIDPARPTRYRTPDGWVEGRLRTERIAVRDGESVEEQVLETRHGPVIGPALAGETRAIALRTTVLEDGDSLAPLLAMARAHTVEAFEAALARWPGATFNFAFASVAGQIGYRLAGQVPARMAGAGLLPTDGATSPGPSPVLPASAMPHVIDPPAGYVVTANDAPGGEVSLGEEWCEPWRGARIRTLLRGRDAHTVASMQAMQLDRAAPHLLPLRDVLLGSGQVSDPLLVALLRAWDGVATADSAATALLEAVVTELARTLAQRHAGAAAPHVLGQSLGETAPHASFHYRLQGRVIEAVTQIGGRLCPTLAERDRLLGSAVSRAVTALTRRLGTDAARWRWGAVHTLRYRHALGALPVIGPMLSRGPYPLGGDVNTVWQGGYVMGLGYEAIGFVPGYRQVIDLAMWDRSTFQLAAGNVGIPGHPQYDDCIDEYLAGSYRPLLYTAEAVSAHAMHTLRLVPAAAAVRDA